jgi:hypothetical protein
MAPLLEPERPAFWEICEDRYQVRQRFPTSELPVARWHEQIGDPPLLPASSALVHNAHRIEMLGDSTRKGGRRKVHSCLQTARSISSLNTCTRPDWRRQHAEKQNAGESGDLRGVSVREG